MCQGKNAPNAFTRLASATHQEKNPKRSMKREKEGKKREDGKEKRKGIRKRKGKDKELSGKTAVLPLPIKNGFKYLSEQGFSTTASEILVELANSQKQNVTHHIKTGHLSGECTLYFKISVHLCGKKQRK